VRPTAGHFVPCLPTDILYAQASVPQACKLPSDRSRVDDGHTAGSALTAAAGAT